MWSWGPYCSAFLPRPLYDEVLQLLSGSAVDIDGKAMKDGESCHPRERISADLPTRWEEALQREDREEDQS